MIAFLILVFSLAALVQFFVAYCRSLVLVYSQLELSPQALELAQLGSGQIRGEEFGRLMKLVELCPEPGDDRAEIRAVRIYYGLLNLLRVLRPLAPRISLWTDRERAGCAHFVAVALDRRINGMHLRSEAT